MDPKKIIKRGDIILFIFIMLSAALVFLIFLKPAKAADSATGKSVVITKNGREYLNCDLSDDRIIDMGTNVIAIEDGFVYMKNADCKNQICVNTGKINSIGQSIVCLPNRITIRITGKEEGLDAVTK